MSLHLHCIFLTLGASILIVAVAATACGDGERGASVAQSSTVAGDLPSELTKVEETYQALREGFVDREKLDPEKFSEAAVRAIVDSLDDRFTSYFTAERFQMTQETFRGTFEGIGPMSR